MVATGTVKGKTVELDEALPMPDGTRVEVRVMAEEQHPKGSPRAVLQLAGTLTHDEAERIRQGLSEIRRVDRKLWDAE